MSDGVLPDLAAIEAAEARLAARSVERRTWRERDERRARRRPYLALAALPVAGAAVLVALLGLSGGDLGGWPRPLAHAAVLAVFVVPAVVAGRLRRDDGAGPAVAWGALAFAAQLAVTFGVAFALLGLGPE